MSSVNILLNKYQFYAGDKITGKAVCNFRSSKDVRKVRVRLRGDESTHWIVTEVHNSEDGRTTRKVNYSGNRNIILQDIIVHGEGILDAGEHVFPFEFLLPEDLPGSFQHKFGEILFSVKLTVDLPWKKDYESKKAITIFSPVKLQMISSNLLQPVEFSDEKTICCWCCASGPIQMDVSLDKRAFILGENADIKIYCSNMSNINIESVFAEIKLTLTFMTTSPSTDYQYEPQVVKASHNSGVGAHGENTFNLSLQIPPSTVVPNFTRCKLFNCKTTLKVNAALAGCHTDLAIKTNVVLGHVPLPQPDTVVAEYGQSPPPYPLSCIESVPMFMPMPMPMPMHVPTPMPMPGYQEGASDVMELPPYPYSPLGPRAPHGVGAPSDPLQFSRGGNPDNLEAGSSHALDPSPPTYEEASKNL